MINLPYKVTAYRINAFAPFFQPMTQEKDAMDLSSSILTVAWYHKNVCFINISVRLVLKILFILPKDIKLLHSLWQIKYFSQTHFTFRCTKLHIYDD